MTLTNMSELFRQTYYRPELYSEHRVGSRLLEETLMEEEVEELPTRRVLLLYKRQRDARNGFRNRDQVEVNSVIEDQAESRSDLIRRFKFSNGSVIEFEYRSEEQNDRLRGCEYDEARLMQGHGEINQEIIEQVVHPSVLSRGGHIIRIGTPRSDELSDTENTTDDSFFARNIGRPLFDGLQNFRAASTEAQSEAVLTADTMLAARDILRRQAGTPPTRLNLSPGHMSGVQEAMRHAASGTWEAHMNSSHLPIHHNSLQSEMVSHRVETLVVASELDMRMEERPDVRGTIMSMSVRMAGQLNDGIENHIVKEASTEVLERLRLKIKNEMKRRDNEDESDDA